jgi:hypothetical protein
MRRLGTTIATVRNLGDLTLVFFSVSPPPKGEHSMSRQITSARQVGRFSSIPSGRSLLLLLLLLQITLIVPRLHAQDPSQIMQQLTDLQQQMAGATDPCPFMPKLKALINQIANQSPEVYQAMKPSLDLLNSQDDGCKTIATDASPEPTPTSTASPNPGGKPTGIGTGTAAPPSCVYLSPSQPCVPLAQYQQMQAQHKASGNGICPASGFVPGVMMHPTSDVAVGIPCKPGTPYGPLIATTASGGYTGVTPPDPASEGGPFDPALNDCIVYFYKNDPITGDHLILQNNCSVRARVWFYASSQAYGAESLDPGEAGNTYAGHDKIVAAGGVSIYACPEGDMPRQADGTLAENGVNNRYRCSRK